MLIFFILLWMNVEFDYPPSNSFEVQTPPATKTPATPETGTITATAEFWIGPPEIASSMVLLKLSEGTEVTILEEGSVYHKVMHRNLVGYVEASRIEFPEIDSAAFSPV